MASATAPFFCCWHVSACGRVISSTCGSMTSLGQMARCELRGKGRREVQLPLPQDAGDALLGYLATTRPSVACEHVFLRLSAPHRPFAVSSSISSVIRLALERAGIHDAPTRGANLLRHSAATRVLRAGATLDAVETVFGTAPRIRTSLTTPRSTWPCSGRWHSAGRGASHAER